MFEIKIKAACAADVSSTPVAGSVHLFSAAEKLAYSAAYSQFTDGDQVGIIGLVDDWVGRCLIDCDAKMGGSSYAELSDKDRTVYVAHLPFEAKQAALHTALGAGELTGGAEGNSESGPSSG